TDAPRLLRTVSRQDDLEATELVGAILDLGNSHRRPDNERPVDCAGGDRVDGGEIPVGKWALHDLESLRNPIDALEDGVLVTRYGRRTPEVQLDLGLDTWLEQMSDP